MKISPEYCDKCGVAQTSAYEIHGLGTFCYDCLETYHPDQMP